jgi:hypothetical protein
MYGSQDSVYRSGGGEVDAPLPWRVVVATCGGTLTEPSVGELQCSLGPLCAVAATIRTYYAISDEALIGQIRDVHPDWRPGWVLPG